jgi:uncharacterized damage-inducible protein DinB
MRKEDPMSTLRFCRERRDAETPLFAKVLKAIPEANRDYRPEPRSRTAAEIAWVLAQEEGALLSLLETGTVTWTEVKPPARLAEIIAVFERNAAAVNKKLQELDDDGWGKKARFLMGEGIPPWDDTIEHFVWGFLFDAIHHRGQISTYLRPMGGKVPSIYGPSADDPGH